MIIYIYTYILYRNKQLISLHADQKISFYEEKITWFSYSILLFLRNDD